MSDQIQMNESQQFSQILAQTLCCQNLKLDRKISKKITEFQHYKQIINENNQILHQVPEGDNCLFRAVSTALYFTPNFYGILQKKCLEFLNSQEILNQASELPSPILTLLEDSQQLSDFCKNPFHSLNEKINLQLISLANEIRIILYTIQDGYLCSTIFNNNFDTTIELFKTSDSKNQNHYNVIFSQKKFEIMKISQQILLNTLDEKFGICYNVMNNNIYKNFEYDNWFIDQEKQQFDQEAFDEEQAQLQQLSSHEKQQLRRHKKSLSDNFNINFEENKNDQQEFELVVMDNSNELVSKNQYFNNNAVLQDAFLSDSNLSSMKNSRQQSQEKIQLPTSPNNNKQINLNNINPGEQNEIREDNHIIKPEQEQKAAENDGDNKQYFSTPQKTQKKFSNENNTSNEETQASQDPNQGSAIIQLLNLNSSPNKNNGQIRHNQPFQNMHIQTQNMSHIQNQQLQNQQQQFPQQTFNSYSQMQPNIMTTNPSYQMPNFPFQKQSSQQQIQQQMAYQQPSKQQSPGHQTQNTFMQSSNQKQGFSPSQQNRIPLQQQQSQKQLVQQQQQQQSQQQQQQNVITDNKRYQGRLKFFDEGKQFGFIIMDEDNSDIFVHQDDLLMAEVQLEFLKTAKQGNIIRFEFNCLTYMGKYRQSRKAVNLQVLEINQQ